jgi:hypothetical protein
MSLARAIILVGLILFSRPAFAADIASGSSKCSPAGVTAETSDGKWQVWFAHASCFKGKLVDPPDAPGFFDPAHF